VLAVTTPSGPAWCDQFPCSVQTNNLASPFREAAEAFLEALRTAGAVVTVSTTFRPAERAYLMHWSWLIARGRVQPGDVPPREGVDIDWTHGPGHLADARQAASAMVATYGISTTMPYPPSLTSNHTLGLAIDMTVAWRGSIFVTDARGASHLCTAQADLWPVGASYGVHKLATDPPHWSVDGH
jgi:hypothetical protein